MCEQKEKTGKFLGMFGGKMEHEVEWVVPLEAITSINSQDEGMLGRKEMLSLATNGANDIPESIQLELKGGAENEEWQKLMQQAKSSALVSVNDVEGLLQSQ